MAESATPATPAEDPSTQDQKPPPEPIEIQPGDLQPYVGSPPFTSDRIFDQTPAGVVMGLAWTAMGGSTLYIEAAVVEQGDNKGSLKATGMSGPWAEVLGAIGVSAL